MKAEELKYVILKSHSATKLTATVNEYIANGWKPQGSHQVVTKNVFVERAKTHHRYEVEYTQTVTR
jgi:hypothetical protein